MDSRFCDIQELLDTWIERFFQFETILRKAALMVPLPAIRARAKVHRIGFIWAVGLATNAANARVKAGLPPHVEWYNNQYIRRYTPLQSKIGCCMLYECRMIRRGWVLEEATNHRIQRRGPSLKKVPEIVGRDIVFQVTIN